MDKIERLKEIIESSNNIVFFGGAGVSTASGIPDFRSSSGLYSSQYKSLRPEYIISHSYFIKDPNLFYTFYKEKMIFPNAKPNYAHIALAKLEKAGKLKAVITQNIDNLHQMAGSSPSKVIELHGSVYRNKCMKCKEKYDLAYVLDAQPVPYCKKCGGLVKPEVVLYEEPLNNYDIETAINYIARCDTLIVAGTSLTVNPAAGLVQFFRGTNFVIINLSETPYDFLATLVIKEPVDRVFEKII